MATFHEAWAHMLNGRVAECKNAAYQIENGKLWYASYEKTDDEHLDVKLGACKQFDAELFFAEWRLI